MLAGKAMIVDDVAAHRRRALRRDRRAAAGLALATTTTEGVIKVVITGNATDPARVPATHPQQARAQRASRNARTDPNDQLELVIVRDMWLTGFDSPADAHHVRRQADARRLAHAGHHPRQPHLQGQAVRSGRRLHRHRRGPQGRTRQLHRPRQGGPSQSARTSASAAIPEMLAEHCDRLRPAPRHRLGHHPRQRRRQGVRSTPSPRPSTTSSNPSRRTRRRRRRRRAASSTPRRRGHRRLKKRFMAHTGRLEALFALVPT